MISIFLNNDKPSYPNRQYNVHSENYEFVYIEGDRIVIHSQEELPTLVAKYDPQGKVWKAVDGETYKSVEIRGEPYGKNKA